MTDVRGRGGNGERLDEPETVLRRLEQELAGRDAEVRRLSDEGERLRSLLASQIEVERWATAHAGAMAAARAAAWLRRPSSAGLRLLTTYLALLRSRRFDARYYLTMYPQVMDAGRDPLWDYVDRGWREGRDPSPSFRTRDYLAARPDVERSGVNPFLHHLRHEVGGRERGSAREALPRIATEAVRLLLDAIRRVRERESVGRLRADLARRELELAERNAELSRLRDEAERLRERLDRASAEGPAERAIDAARAKSTPAAAAADAETGAPRPDEPARGAVGRLRSAAGDARLLVPFQDDAIERRALRSEQEAASAFARRYAETVPTIIPAGAPEAPGEALPTDRRGVLAVSGAPPDGRPSVDIVVCVHDALGDLRRCLRSLIAKTGRPFHLILVDDGSGPETSAFLSRFSAENENVTLITREGPPHGYTLAANDGVRASSGDYVVLLNSDTIVTFGWLERIVECGESDPSLGIVGPLSNAASYQSIPNLKEGGAWAVNELPPFLTADVLALLLPGLSATAYPRFPFVNGFCYAIKREVIDAVGLFDEEHFASGYCEENDFSLRTSQAGFGLAVADDAYVFHAKSRSYGQEGRREIASRNYRIFLDKHGQQNVDPLVRSLDRDQSLNALRELVSEATADEASLERAFHSAFPHPLNVGFVLHGMGRGAAGGVHSIYQETRGMRALGIDARVFVPRDGLDNARRLYPDADEVFVGFGGDDELYRASEDRDVLVATHFMSVASVRRLRERRDDFLPAYYVQDYEPFFFAGDSTEGRAALASYTAVEDQLLFAKTQWLCDLVGRLHDRHVAKVEPSIDHAVYRPGERRRRGRRPARVAAMVRHRTWRRQPVGTLRILDRLQAELGTKVEVRAFGSEARELRRLSPERAGRVENLGLLTREEVAATLARSDVFLDFSSYQAFGRTALEAMACGCAPIVPRVGGPDEYAVHGKNAFVVDTTSEDAAFDAIAELVGDRKALRRMQEQAVETAQGFSVMRAALSEYVLFADECTRRRQ